MGAPIGGGDAVLALVRAPRLLPMNHPASRAADGALEITVILPVFNEAQNLAVASDRCLSLGGYVTRTGGHGGGRYRCRRVLVLACMKRLAVSSRRVAP
jgi:hypothetical protein